MNEFFERIYSLRDKLGSIDLKTIDGIDEVATLGGQILPGVAGLALSLGIILPATYFVYQGVIGLKEEYEESCEELKEITEKKTKNRTKLLHLLASSDEYRRIINKECNLNIKKNPLFERKAKQYSQKELSDAIINYHKIRKQHFIAKLGAKYGWTGSLGMFGMLMALLTSSTAFAFGIATKFSPVASQSLIASSLAVISGGFFLIGQASIMVYASNRIRQGNLKIKAINKDLKILKKDNSLDRTTREHLSNILHHERKFAYQNYIYYGYATILGQTFMAAGTIAALAGAAPAASIILFLIGAPATLVPAIARCVSENKEGKFYGQGLESEYSKKRIAEIDKNKANAMKSGNLELLEKDFNKTTAQLAKIKLYSLLAEIISNPRLAKLPADEKVAKLLGNFKQSSKRKPISIKNSGLEPEITNLTHDILCFSQDEIEEFLKLDLKAAQKKLLVSVAKCIEEDTPNTLFATSKELSPSREKTLKELGVDPEKDLSSAIKEVIEPAKEALKSIRKRQSHGLVEMLEIEKTTRVVMPQAENIKERKAETTKPTTSLSEPRTQTNASMMQSHAVSEYTKHPDSVHQGSQKQEELQSFLTQNLREQSTAQTISFT